MSWTPPEGYYHALERQRHEEHAAQAEQFFEEEAKAREARPAMVKKMLDKIDALDLHRLDLGAWPEGDEALDVATLKDFCDLDPPWAELSEDRRWLRLCGAVIYDITGPALERCNEADDRERDRILDGAGYLMRYRQLGSVAGEDPAAA